MLGNLLRRVGYHCRMAHSVEEGRVAIGEHPYDAIFLDIHLPDGSGYELIPEIRRRMPFARCITISAVDAERDRAIAAGADSFLAKPFSREQIWRSIGIAGNSHNPA